MRAPVYALISWLLLSVYGGKVCSVIAQYPFWGWALWCLSAYAAQALLRPLLEPRLVLAPPLDRQAPRQLRLELAMTLVTALYMALVAHLIVHSPTENAFKVAVAVTLMGLFFSLELTLDRERRAVLKALEEGVAVAPGGRYFSLTTKFALVAAAAVVLGAVAVSGVVVKDIYIYFSGEMGDDWGQNIRSVMLDIFYVLGVMLAQGLWCLMSFAKNLRLYFGLQTKALERVAGGDLDAAVPVMTRDEFGLIAEGTNQMIEGLRERRRIKDIFGKLVSPQIAERLLSRGADLGGERLTVAVVFADIRGFTTLSENIPPEEVVALLNDHFTRLVETVHAGGGLVDKFIGDAVMAVFGLDGAADAPARAVEAAMAMVEASTMETGAGVHVGPVVAGNIGSPERLEYTVIGDTVNTAARLQEATRQTGAGVMISREVMDRLPEAVRQRFEDLGPRELRGRSEAVGTFGLRRDAETPGA